MTHSQRTNILLRLVPPLHYLTTANVCAVTGWSYDITQRLLKKNATGEKPLIDAIRPPVPQEGGSVRQVYVLAAEGAKQLAALDAQYRLGDLMRLVRACAKQRRRIERGRPSQLDHRLAIANLVAFLIRFFGDRDPSARFSYFRRDPTFRVDVGEWAARLSVQQQAAARVVPGTTEAIYRPDFLFVVRWTPVAGEPVRRDLVSGEVETGLGQRDERSIGEEKGRKIAGFLREYPSQPDLRTQGIDENSRLHFIVWTATHALERSFAEGLARVQRKGWRGVRLTSGDSLPIDVPSKTAKAAFADMCAALVAAMDEPVFFVMGKHDSRVPLLSRSDVRTPAAYIAPSAAATELPKIDHQDDERTSPREAGRGAEVTTDSNDSLSHDRENSPPLTIDLRDRVRSMLDCQPKADESDPAHFASPRLTARSSSAIAAERKL